MWRVNDRGQDACSFFFPDGQRIVWTSTRDNMEMPVGNWSDFGGLSQGGEIYTSDLKGPERPAHDRNEYYEAEVSVSPGRQSHLRPPDRRPWISGMKADGTEERQVTKTDD